MTNGHVITSEDVFWIWIGGIFAVALYREITKRLSQWQLRSCSPSEVVLEISPLWRLWMGLGCFIVVLPMPIFLTVSVTHPQDVTDLLCLLLMDGLLLALAVMIFNGSGPIQVRFDPANNTFSYRDGWFWHCTFSAPLADFQCIHLCPKTWTNSSKEYAKARAGDRKGLGTWVWLGWQGTQGWDPKVSLKFGTVDQARKLAQQLSDVLRIPVTESRQVPRGWKLF